MSYVIRERKESITEKNKKKKIENQLKNVRIVGLNLN